MLSSLKKMICEFKALVAKMAKDYGDLCSKPSHRKATKANFNISMPLVLSGFLPLLETMHQLMKFFQEGDIFISKYMGVIKVCLDQLYELYLLLF
jgi:hypothetical protein